MQLSSLNPLTNPAPFHILTYGTLLGTNIFQSFIAGIVAFRALPRPSFASLQTAITPYYFALQTFLPLGLALTWPAPRGNWTQPSHIPNGLAGVFGDSTTSAGASGVRNALVSMAVMGAVNWLVLGPMTTSTMKERKRQETRDGKKYWDAGPQSKEMQGLNWRFTVLHSISALVNLIDVGVCVWYGVWLGDRLV